MLEKIQKLDTELLVYLNGLGSETYDKLWLIITSQLNWTPLFLLFFYLMYKKIGGETNFVCDPFYCRANHFYRSGYQFG